jgi:hypothetical protein
VITHRPEDRSRCDALTLGPRTLGRIPCRLAARGSLTALLAVTLVRCNGGDTASPTARAALAIRATVHGLSATKGLDPTVRIRVTYADTGGAITALPSSPGAISVLTGTATTQPVLVDLGPCLADRQRVPAGEPGCQVTVSLILFLPGVAAIADSEAATSATPVLPGVAAELPPITLTVAGSIQLSAHELAVTTGGAPFVISAAVIDASGALLANHPVAWSVANGAIASVTPTGPGTARVSGVGPGLTTVRATSGTAADSALVYVSATGEALIGLSQTTWVDTVSLSHLVEPPPLLVTVTDSGNVPLTGLQTDTVSYGSGSPFGWIQQGLADTVATTTLTVVLIPRIFDTVGPGTYTANFQVSSPVAANSPRTFDVTVVVVP